MKKSIAQWLRNLALAGFASASWLTNNTIYAHDLPIFDSLTPLNCFGIGSCGFPITGNLSDLPNHVAPINAMEGEVVEATPGWSFSDCFGDSYQDPPGRTVSPDFSSLGQGDSHCEEYELETHEDEFYAPDQQPIAFRSDFSYPLSYLSLIQAIGIRFPRFDLKETLNDFPKAILEMYNVQKADSDIVGQPKVETNYLNTRPLVDDYLDGESFVRDWRTDQSYRGLSRFDYLYDESMTESLAVAVPKRPRVEDNPWFEAILQTLVDFQCRSSQELRDFQLTGHLGQMAGRSLANFDYQSFVAIHENANSLLVWASEPQPVADQVEFAQLDTLFGQPAFVICQLEGKEFLLPAKQAKHWNSVPSFQSSPVKTPAENTLASEFAATQSILMRELAYSVSDGLELVATQLQQFAGRLRAVAQDESQVANRSEVEGIR